MDAFASPGSWAPAVLPDGFVTPQGIGLLRAANTGWSSDPGDTPANTSWYPRLLGDVELSQSAVDALGIGGRVALGLAQIDLWDGDGALADLARYGTADGRKATIRIASAAAPRASNTGAPLSATTVAFAGIVRSIDAAAPQRARLSLADAAERLATPLQSTRYGGTGGIDGPTALAGRPKPVALGRAFNVQPVALGNIDLGDGSLPTYQTHWRAVVAHDAVRIRGVAQTKVTVAPAVGQYRDWPSSGVFQIGSSPDGTVTADVRGDTTPAYAGTTTAVLKRLVQSLGPGYADADLDADAWTIADSDLPGEIGWCRGADEITASDAAAQILAASGAVIAGSRAGLLRLFDPLAIDTPQFVLQPAMILDLVPVALPATLRPIPRAVAVDWRRNWTPLSELAGSVAGTDRAQLGGQASGPARADSAIITARVAQQRDLRFNGLYWAEADALARARKWRAWLEAGPRLFEATTDRFLGQIECGDIGRIAYPSWGLDDGVLGVVVGWREALAARRLTITFATLPEA